MPSPTVFTEQQVARAIALELPDIRGAAVARVLARLREHRAHKDPDKMPKATDEAVLNAERVLRRRGRIK